MVEDWYAEGFRMMKWRSGNRIGTTHPTGRGSTFLPPLAPPSGQQGSDNQQDDQPGGQQ